jgi:hypothetical protein
MLKVTALATLVAGTLDILFAVILTLLYGREPADMLRSVASGPFPAATEMAGSGVVLGLLVHFALMAAMAAIFVAIARLRPAILQTPYLFRDELADRPASIRNPAAAPDPVDRDTALCTHRPRGPALRADRPALPASSGPTNLVANSSHYRVWRSL